MGAMYQIVPKFVAWKVIHLYSMEVMHVLRLEKIKMDKFKSPEAILLSATAVTNYLALDKVITLAWMIVTSIYAHSVAAAIMDI